ncbi:hypothetical protein ACRAWD_08005 [Caulobacter segnis]
MVAALAPRHPHHDASRRLSGRLIEDMCRQSAHASPSDGLFVSISVAPGCAVVQRLAP